MTDKIKILAVKIEKEQRVKYAEQYKGTPQNCIDINAKTTIKVGKKYIKIDIGRSGAYMVDQDGYIFGVKAYGVIHRGYKYGTLDTIDNYFWGGYRAVKIA